MKTNFKNSRLSDKQAQKLKELERKKQRKQKENTRYIAMVA